jgi:MoxR-like ATPase
MVVRMGYPTREDEERLLAEQGAGDPVAAIEPVATVADVRTAIAAARALHVEPAVNGYAVSILERTRDDARLSLGASPRAGVALMRVARARALLEGRLFVTPDDVRAVAVPVLAHRLQLAGAARAAGAEAAGIVDELVARTPVPM